MGEPIESLQPAAGIATRGTLLWAAHAPMSRAHAFDGAELEPIMPSAVKTGGPGFTPHAIDQQTA